VNGHLWTDVDGWMEPNRRMSMDGWNQTNGWWWMSNEMTMDIEWNNTTVRRNGIAIWWNGTTVKQNWIAIGRNETAIEQNKIVVGRNEISIIWKFNEKSVDVRRKTNGCPMKVKWKSDGCLTKARWSLIVTSTMTLAKCWLWCQTNVNYTNQWCDIRQCHSQWCNSR